MAFKATLERYVEERQRHIDCGILGTKYIMHALTELGRADLSPFPVFPSRTWLVLIGALRCTPRLRVICANSTSFSVSGQHIQGASR